MRPTQRMGPISVIILSCTIMAVIPAIAPAYTQYSQDGDNTYCASCHGDFRASSYISTVDGQDWGNLHNLHRSDMLNGDCDACHIAADRFPVPLSESAGGDGLDPVGCTGCHGRDEDNVAANPDFPNGQSAGLRQHHTNAGVNICLDCHQDADPANYTPVGEDILPAYYANPGTDHPQIPTGPCNDDGSENFAGFPIGLDNDGDQLYDGDDLDCSSTDVTGETPAVARLMQNHPNPFNPHTTIEYVMDGPGQARLQVFSATGELVRTLVNAYHGEASTYRTTWDGRDDNGRSMPSGTFFYRLESKSGVEMKTMVLLK